MRRLAAVVVWLACGAVHAHSASDAYLTLDVAGRGSETVVEGRWDIALRDLHFVLGLDDDGDGAVTWGETKRHRADIERYAYERLRASGDGAPCTLARGAQLASSHADGAYAALAFRIVCKGAPRKVTLDYRLFFDVDPTHRGIVVVRARGATSTALVSPASTRIEVARP